MNFRIPPGDRHENDWKSLTSVLFSFLQESLAREQTLDFDAYFDDLATWRVPFIEKAVGAKREKLTKQWDIARALIWCARQAVSTREFAHNEIDRAIFELQEVPDFVQHHMSWAWNCIHLFRGTSVVKRSYSVPVAVVTTEYPEGVIAVLRLECLEGGAGQIFHYPGDTLGTYADASFEAAMKDAWQANRSLLTLTHFNDGRWRLLRPGGEQINGVSGRSAGGAAAWGWWFVLQGKVPDPGIIILTECDRNGFLSSVQGIKLKVKAIANDKRNHFDTIVVTDDHDLRDAEDALGYSGATNRIRVVKYDHKRDGQ